MSLAFPHSVQIYSLICCFLYFLWTLIFFIRADASVLVISAIWESFLYFLFVFPVILKFCSFFDPKNVPQGEAEAKEGQGGRAEEAKRERGREGLASLLFGSVS